MAKIAFRPEAIQPFSTPDQIDQPFRLVTFKAWLPLMALAVVCAMALAWAFVGRIPETVEGAGVLLQAGRVRIVQAPAGGQVVSFEVRPGQVVARDAVLARVALPELRKQLTQAQARLEELKQLDERQRTLEKVRAREEAAYREVQERVLGKTVREGEKLVESFEKKHVEVAREQRQRIAQVRKATAALGVVLREQAEKMRRLGMAEMLVSADKVLAAEAAALENSVQVSQLDQKAAELELREVEANQQLMQQRARLADLRLQLDQLTVKATQLRQETAQAQATRRAMVQEQEERIDRLRNQLEEQSVVRSPYSGKVLEFALQPGQMAAPGGRLAVIELTGPDGKEELDNLAYFPVRSGKRILPGMEVRVTPTTVQRERFGSILGKVKRVSPFPVSEDAVVAAVGNPELVKGLFQPGGMIEVEVELERADTYSGFRWTSAGPPVKITPGTTARVRVMVEKRAPITFLLPVLRSFLSGERDPDAEG